eukprot:g9471.t1
MSIACFVDLSLLYVYIDSSDRGQGQEGQDLKTISGVDSGFAYFRHRRSSPLIPRLDILNVGCRQFILGWVFFGIVSSRLMLR